MFKLYALSSAPSEEDAGGLVERFGVTLSVAMGEEIEHRLGG